MGASPPQLLAVGAIAGYADINLFSTSFGFSYWNITVVNAEPERPCVVRPPSSLFHLSYDLIMTIECGRRRHPGGTGHTQHCTGRDANKTRPSALDPLCPIDRPVAVSERRRDLAATDRPNDRLTPDVKFRRRPDIHTCHIHAIDSTLHSGAA